MKADTDRRQLIELFCCVAAVDCDVVIDVLPSVCPSHDASDSPAVVHTGGGAPIGVHWSTCNGNGKRADPAHGMPFCVISGSCSATDTSSNSR